MNKQEMIDKIEEAEKVKKELNRCIDGMKTQIKELEDNNKLLASDFKTEDRDTTYKDVLLAHLYELGGLEYDFDKGNNVELAKFHMVGLPSGYEFKFKQDSINTYNVTLKKKADSKLTFDDSDCLIFSTLKDGHLYHESRVDRF